MNEEQIRLIFSYWPDLEDYDLQVQFEMHWEPWSSITPPRRFSARGDNRPPVMKTPIRLYIYHVVDFLFFTLLGEMNRPEDTERQRKALAAWREYVEVTPYEAALISAHWQQIYRPYILE